MLGNDCDEEELKSNVELSVLALTTKADRKGGFCVKRFNDKVRP